MAMQLLVIQVAGLTRAMLRFCPRLAAVTPPKTADIVPVFPALTCPAQATLRTALSPVEHGIVANGRFDRRTRQADFWNQSARLVEGPRIWEEYRRRGRRVGMLFWQQSLGEDVDLLLSPAPIHRHGGGMIDDCYCLPRDLYPTLCKALGRRFKLSTYWGPLASDRSAIWIARAAEHILRTPQLRPDLLFTYIPHLDYALQRYGPDDQRRLQPHLETLADVLDLLISAAQEVRVEVLVWGDYAMTPVRRVVFPNRVLRERGLLEVRMVRGRAYHDPYRSKALAVVDHQAAHVYVDDAARREEVRNLFENVPGVDRVLEKEALPHPESGDLILVAEPDAWFAYPWWTDPHEAPDYAGHVDIHRKPGYDPCELFFGRLLPPSVSFDVERVRGSHGRTDEPALMATTLDLEESPGDLVRLARMLHARLSADAW